MLIKKVAGAFLLGVGGMLPHYTMGYTWKIPKAMRHLGAKLFFEFCGKNVDIGRHAKVTSKISIGDRSGIGDNCYLQGRIVMGKDIMMAPEVAIIATNHNFDSIDIPMNQQGHTDETVEIEDDCWLGYRSIICAGVKIGKGSIVAAGAVVTRNVPEFSIVAGVPARVIRSRK